jgi:hypothetical protein
MKPRKTTYMKPTANGTCIGRAGKLQYSYSTLVIYREKLGRCSSGKKIFISQYSVKLF